MVPESDSNAKNVPVSQLSRLAEVMHRLRNECPWDAQQTHLSLVKHLIEEVGETVDAIETGSDQDLLEELGDLLLQIYFHAEIAAEQDRFTIEDVAAGICDKLVSRHPYVFADSEIPDDLDQSWEQRKQRAKHRESSLDGIAENLSSLARAHKVISRARNNQVPIDFNAEPITAEEVGTQILNLVCRAQASGVDADQALRSAVRVVEEQVRSVEDRIRQVEKADSDVPENGQ